MASRCKICSSPFRETIEREAREAGTDSMAFKKVAEKWGVSEAELQRHVLLHADLPSLVSKANIREAAFVSETIVTNRDLVNTLAEEIRNAITDSGVNSISKNTVDLFLGASKNVYDGARALADINVQVNGDSNQGISALGKLVQVLGSASSSKGGETK